MQRHRIRFTPVPLKARHDGWTAERQRHFIDELARTRSIVKACRVAGMSRMSAYKLRDRDTSSDGFASAWRRALSPDFDRPRRPSPRAAARLRRLARRSEVYEVHEMHGPPDSPPATAPTSSALTTLQTLLAVLRASDQELGSARGE